jgi:hypothetical protein
VLSFGQTYPVKMNFEVKLKSFFYYKRERESEFTQENGCSLAVLSLMGIILAFWGKMGQVGNWRVNASPYRAGRASSRSPKRIKSVKVRKKGFSLQITINFHCAVRRIHIYSYCGVAA